jgi:hypothetical protein
MTLYRQLNSFIPSSAWESTVGIVIVYGEAQELHQFGTGTLLKVADDVLLVTAAHVIRQAYQQDKGLCVATGNSFTQIYGDWYLSESDAFDIAALRLPKNVVSELKAVSYFRLQDIDFSSDLSNGIFCLFGYPGLLSKPSTPKDTMMSLKPFQYTTYAYPGETGGLSAYQERYHLLLDGGEELKDVEGKPVLFHDRNGNRLQVPRDLGGISGCSVWKIGDRNRPLSQWKQYRPRVVAVQTGVYPERQVIKATRWVAISTLLYEAYPDLRPVMSLAHVEYR